MQQKPSLPAWKQKQEIREIAATVSRLLAHYWTADDRVETRQAQIEDWIDDLAEFGPAIVYQVCRDWRRERSHRPLPGDIRTLCIAVQITQREQLLLADPKHQRWPRWLEETWGPEPDGPRKRAEAMAQTGDQP